MQNRADKAFVCLHGAFSDLGRNKLVLVLPPVDIELRKRLCYTSSFLYTRL